MKANHDVNHLGDNDIIVMKKGDCRMNPFVYEIPTKVYFGENQLQYLGNELKQFEIVYYLCMGEVPSCNGVYDTVISQIEQIGMEVFELSGVEPNPRVDTVRRGSKALQR